MGGREDEGNERTLASSGVAMPLSGKASRVCLMKSGSGQYGNSIARIVTANKIRRISNGYQIHEIAPSAWYIEKMPEYVLDVRLGTLTDIAIVTLRPEKAEDVLLIVWKRAFI